MSDTPITLWNPSKERLNSSVLFNFAKAHNLDLSMRSVYQWSLENPEKFWDSVWSFFQIRGEKGNKAIQEPLDKTLKDKTDYYINTQFFPGSKLNYSYNLLNEALDQSCLNKTALSFYGEDKILQTLSYGQLATAVLHVRNLLTQDGVKKHDVIAGIVPNCPLSVIAMLAATSIGAIWTSCSPDFGVDGIIDRFGQTNPKIIFTTNGYYFKSNKIDLSGKIQQVMSSLPSVKKIYWWDYTNQSFQPNVSSALVEQVIYSDIDSIKYELIKQQIDSFELFEFNHPLYIMYSSGTTGKPKCIVHRAGGILIEQIKEWGLHVEVSKEDVCFYQTTCGWMMWNWLICALFFKTKIVLFDGSPILDDGKFLFNLIQKEKISIFGTNAKFLSLCEKLEVLSKYEFNFDSLKTILSTGSPLSPESFSFVYSKIKSDVCLSSIAGGTDILGCFALGSPTLPVYQGELQCRSLGLAVSCFDDNQNQIINTPGELVCTKPFPSMPLGFWNDSNNEKFKAAYFDEIPGVWRHGDLVKLTDRGTMVFLGRSDTVLNPGGIRIGSAEIYNTVDSLDFMEESVVIGRRNHDLTDEVMILFVKLKNNIQLTDEHKLILKENLRSKCSPHHVPKFIYQVSDIPKTRSGKIVEAAVRAITENKSIKNLEAIANPECLSEFQVGRS
jgi:acetoacetyl-CoA synthetase